MSTIRDIRTFADEHSLVEEAAEIIVSAAKEAIVSRGRFLIALSGGSTPEPVYRLLANAAYRLGRTLQFDAQTERCIDDDEANRLLAPSYREPYVVPEEV